jgi:hypothetical protein
MPELQGFADINGFPRKKANAPCRLGRSSEGIGSGGGRQFYWQERRLKGPRAGGKPEILSPDNKSRVQEIRQ